jgi:hypothetical protein
VQTLVPLYVRAARKQSYAAGFTLTLRYRKGMEFPADFHNVIRISLLPFASFTDMILGVTEFKISNITVRSFLQYRDT